MGLKISPLQESDIPDFVRIELEAFRSHPRIPMVSLMVEVVHSMTVC